MKNIKYFPFERNKYFYGKLLTVDDFQMEQKYMNDKRRMMNRFLHGMGVVCGLQVVVVNDSTISVEPGFALDFCGREIVMENPDVRTLSMIDGFNSYREAEEENGYVYLCIDYDEVEHEPVHSISNSNVSGREEYNKYQETYHLFLTDQEPEKPQAYSLDFYQEQTLIYWGYGFRILQNVPKYVNRDQEFEICVVVENMGQARLIQFQYELELSCFQYQGQETLRIEFDEEKTGKQMRHEQRYYLKAENIKDTVGKMTLREGSFLLWLDRIKMEGLAAGESTAQILDREIAEEVKKKYYNHAMEQIVQQNCQQSIYLAKIGIVRAGDTYIINQIEAIPFQQYVHNQTITELIQHVQQAEQKRISYRLTKREEEKAKREKENNSQNIQIAKGTVMLNLGIGGNIGKVFYSEEIAHGLGLGNVVVIPGAAYDAKGNGAIVYGSGDIFKDSEADYQANLAVKVDGTKGTFQIGVKLTEPTTKQQIRIFWTAIRDNSENYSEVEEKSLTIKPDLMYLYTRESYHLKAVFHGVGETEVTWTVREEMGGTVDSNGNYTASNVPGIYEVVVKSVEYPELRGSAFLVVREEK